LLAYTEDLQDRLRQNNITFPTMDERLKKEAEPKNNVLSEVKRHHLKDLRNEYTQDDKSMQDEAAMTGRSQMMHEATGTVECTDIAIERLSIRGSTS
jgi:hypothetical protein